MEFDLSVAQCFQLFAELGIDEWYEPDSKSALDAQEEMEYKAGATSYPATLKPLGDGNNWVTQTGGLPLLIRRVANHLLADGKDKGEAVAIAVNWAKKMCATGRAFGGKVKVGPKARAAACAAVAEWEAKKGESHAKTEARHATEDAKKSDDPDIEMKGDPVGTENTDMTSVEYKNVGVTGVHTIDEDKGIVETIVSVTGIVDEVKDVIVPGAYAKTLAIRTPKGAWGHDWNSPVSKTLACEELMPGDPRLPKTIGNGQPWPKAAGALLVKTQFNLNGERGKQAFEDVKFFADDQEWSIGYQVPVGGAKMDAKTGQRIISTLDLYEYSPVLFGAMPLAKTQSVKSAQLAFKALAGRPTGFGSSSVLDEEDGEQISEYEALNVDEAKSLELSAEDAELVSRAVDALKGIFDVSVKGIYSGPAQRYDYNPPMSMAQNSTDPNVVAASIQNQPAGTPSAPRLGNAGWAEGGPDGGGGSAYEVMQQSSLEEVVTDLLGDMNMPEDTLGKITDAAVNFDQAMQDDDDDEIEQAANDIMDALQEAMQSADDPNVLSALTQVAQIVTQMIEQASEEDQADALVGKGLEEWLNLNTEPLYDQNGEVKARVVKTPAGASHYKKPIGTVLGGGDEHAMAVPNPKARAAAALGSGGGVRKSEKVAHVPGSGKSAKGADYKPLGSANSLGKFHSSTVIDGQRYDLHQKVRYGTPQKGQYDVYHHATGRHIGIVDTDPKKGTALGRVVGKNRGWSDHASLGDALTAAHSQAKGAGIAKDSTKGVGVADAVEKPVKAAAGAMAEHAGSYKAEGKVYDAQSSEGGLSVHTGGTYVGHVHKRGNSFVTTHNGEGAKRHASMGEAIGHLHVQHVDGKKSLDTEEKTRVVIAEFLGNIDPMLSDEELDELEEKRIPFKPVTDDATPNQASSNMENVNGGGEHAVTTSVDDAGRNMAECNCGWKGKASSPLALGEKIEAHVTQQKWLESHPDFDKEVKRKFSSDKRDELAKAGVAMPDGSFPIENTEDLKNAIQAVGRASDPDAAKAHIKKRAKALESTDLLPDDWKSIEAKAAEAETAVKEDPFLPCPKCKSKEVDDGKCAECGAKLAKKFAKKELTLDDVDDLPAGEMVELDINSFLAEMRSGLDS